MTDTIIHKIYCLIRVGSLHIRYLVSETPAQILSEE
jgi:hypothetical protein